MPISVETPSRFTPMAGEGETALMGGPGGLLVLDVRQGRAEPLVPAEPTVWRPTFRGVKMCHHYSKRLLR